MDIDTESSKMYDYKYEYEFIDPKTNKLVKKDKIITIYENDLKYKLHNNIDVLKILNLDDKIDHDTLKYRIEDCLKTQCKTLDLSHLKLKEFPILPQEILSNIKYLFLSENFLYRILDLTVFTNLRVLDICNNKLTNVPLLPERIEEVLINNNEIIDIDALIKCDYLKRLDCSNNKITNIPIIDSLEILVCDDNKLTKLPPLNIKKLSCCNNQLRELPEFKLIEVIECDDNNIQAIQKYNNLKELYCSNNNISVLDNINKINILHCCDNKITKIDYYENLKELLCDYNPNLDLCSYYTIEYQEVYKNKYILLYFK